MSSVAVRRSLFIVACACLFMAQRVTKVSKQRMHDTLIRSWPGSVWLFCVYAVAMWCGCQQSYPSVCRHQNGVDLMNANPISKSLMGTKMVWMPAPHPSTWWAPKWYIYLMDVNHISECLNRAPKWYGCQPHIRVSDGHQNGMNTTLISEFLIATHMV